MKKLVLALALSCIFVGFAESAPNRPIKWGCEHQTKYCQIYSDAWYQYYNGLSKCGNSSSLSDSLCRLREGLRINYQ